MRPLTNRKKIRLNDVSRVAAKLGAYQPKVKAQDDVDVQAEKLKASGWMAKQDHIPEYLDAAFTYTGLAPMTKPNRKREDKSRDIVVVKRSRQDGERKGMLFTDKRGFED